MPRMCSVCGNKFIPSQKLQKYCSGKCRCLAYYYRKRKRENKRILKNERRSCVVCETEFIPKIFSQTVCSSGCREERKKETSLAWYHKQDKTLLNKKRRKYRQAHKVELARKSRKYKRTRRLKCLRELGDKCIICGSTKKIKFHEIYGKDHDKYEAWGYVLKHLKDFVPMCRDCHRALHHLAKKRKMDMEEFLRLLALLGKL